MASLDKPNFGCCLIDFSFSFVSDVLMSLEQMTTIQVVWHHRSKFSSIHRCSHLNVPPC